MGVAFLQLAYSFAAVLGKGNFRSIFTACICQYNGPYLVCIVTVWPHGSPLFYCGWPMFYCCWPVFYCCCMTFSVCCCWHALFAITYWAAGLVCGVMPLLSSHQGRATNACDLWMHDSQYVKPYSCLGSTYRQLSILRSQTSVALLSWLDGWLWPDSSTHRNPRTGTYWQVNTTVPRLHYCCCINTALPLISANNLTVLSLFHACAGLASAADVKPRSIKEFFDKRSHMCVMQGWQHPPMW